MYLTNSEMEAYSGRQDNFYFNKLKIENLSDDSLVIKSFFHLKKQAEEDQYTYSLDSNYYTATMVLRKINSKLESDRIGWYFINEKVNQLNTKNSLESGSTDPNSLTTNSFTLNSPVTSAKQYGFVVMHVQQDNDNFEEKMNGIRAKSYVFTTGIEEYDFVDDDLKYQILDEAQSSYKRTPAAIAYKGIVKDRDLLLFDSYSEASRAREKYTLSD